MLPSSRGLRSVLFLTQHQHHLVQQKQRPEAKKRNLACLEYLFAGIYCWIMYYTNLVLSYSSFNTLLKYCISDLFENLSYLSAVSFQSILCPPGCIHCIPYCMYACLPSSFNCELFEDRDCSLFTSLCIHPVPDTVPGTYECWRHGDERQDSDVLWNIYIKHLPYRGRYDYWHWFLIQ